ncbi:hypothetical protein CEXT_496251 [Caerostris extrusa]|uniref:Uncharacterized protein n=1 Tax=Caerostris extrusa TaxID=172846 RepID=A0AAV4VR21_CAEEX|nr:hypothetical protein CEXT_496251 [Caerostris extrusa]
MSHTPSKGSHYIYDRIGFVKYSTFRRNKCRKKIGKALLTSGSENLPPIHFEEEIDDRASADPRRKTQRVLENIDFLRNKCRKDPGKTSWLLAAKISRRSILKKKSTIEHQPILGGRRRGPSPPHDREPGKTLSPDLSISPTSLASLSGDL